MSWGRWVLVVWALVLGVVFGVWGKNDVTVTVTGPDSAVVNQAVTFTVQVVGNPQTGSLVPTGTVEVTVDPTGAGELSAASIPLNPDGTCSFTYKPTSGDTSPHTITVSYSGDDNYNSGTGQATLEVKKRKVDLIVDIAPNQTYIYQEVTISVTVQDDTTVGESGIPTGTITFDDSGKNGIFSKNSCTLTDGSCVVTYTPYPGDIGIVEIKVHYDGDSSYSQATSEATLNVSLRPTEISVSLESSTYYVLQDIHLKITVVDTTPISDPRPVQGEVILHTDNPHSFFVEETPSIPPQAVSEITLPLNNGSIEAIYIPWINGNGHHTITINFEDNDQKIFAPSSTNLTFRVQLRPLALEVEGPDSSLLVYERSSLTVTVRDNSNVPWTNFTYNGITPPVNPGIVGTLNASAYLESQGKSSLTKTAGPDMEDASAEWEFDYICTGIDGDAGYDTLYFEYTPNEGQGVFESMKIAYGLAITRRPVKMDLECSCTDTGVTCTATVEDDPANQDKGTPPNPPQGELILVDYTTNEENVIGNAPQTTFDVESDLTLVPITLKFEPTDGIFLRHVEFNNVSRNECLPPISVPEESGNVFYTCDGGCGEGGINVAERADVYKKIVSALRIALLPLRTWRESLNFIPNQVIATGVGLVVGSTVPTANLQKAIAGFSIIAISTTITTLTTDFDNDGLVDVLEWELGTDPYNADTDNDLLKDWEEITIAGGYISTWRLLSLVVDPRSRRPCPFIADSDKDGLIDGVEVKWYGTNVCTTDTDCDTLPDGIELACQIEPSSANGFNIDTFDTWGYSRDAFPFTDPRDWPDPNAADTDGDGLRDDVEFGPGRLATSPTDTNYSPYVNDPDSDGDGILDGEESTNGDAKWDGTIGGTGTTGSGETHLCLADTDGDGLNDNEEEGILGKGPVTALSPSGPVTTVPALDTDSDDDGLSDFEELNITGTDPRDWDSDDDGISDANELKAVSGSWPARQFEQVSDPLDPDTDDDGLPDKIEYPGTGLGTSHSLGGSDDTVCPYVNDDDSDDDGIQDGAEDANHDGSIVNNIGNSSSTGSGETSFCKRDTDGDGLTDGEEDNIFGHANVQVKTAGGALTTVPALDDDMDDDGLSDYEELNITGTDPLNWDTDGDTISDANELIAIGGTWPSRQFQKVSDPLDPNTDDDELLDSQEYSGTGLDTSRTIGGSDDEECPYVNDPDSDNDGIQDGVTVTITHTGPNGYVYTYTFHEGFDDVPAADVQAPGTVRTTVTPATGEQHDDPLCNACDPDSDGDGLTDGEEISLGTDPADWDTDDDGRNDWHEITGGGPTPTDPFDPDTDDDGLLDSAEVFGSNPTNPTVADTDGDGLCDGGAGTPWMTSGDPRVSVNPACKAGIGGHPNPMGLGEDENGNGTWDSNETNPNQDDTDGDGEGDGIEKLGFSKSRQDMIPATDLLGREITVKYPECGCLDPLNPDTDGDGLLDGIEDQDNDGNFDFHPSDFDQDKNLPNSLATSAPGAPIPQPRETNPCDPDTDHDGLTDYEELNQPNPASAYPFNPTNPLDHDTDNDWILDGTEVRYECVPLEFENLDDDGDGLIDEDPLNYGDDDGDGYIDEDGPNYIVKSTPVLDPTNRDSDSDGFIDGLDPDPCNSGLIPISHTEDVLNKDSDGDGFTDIDEQFAGTDPLDPNSCPKAFKTDIDLDGMDDDRVWLVATQSGEAADAVVIDRGADGFVDARIQANRPNVFAQGDFDGDGENDDVRYRVTYSLTSTGQGKFLVTVYDYDGDLVIDKVEVSEAKGR